MVVLVISWECVIYIHIYISIYYNYMNYMNTLGHIDVSWVALGWRILSFCLTPENLTFTQMSISSDTRLKTNMEPTKMMVGRLYFPFEMTHLSRGQFVSFRKCRLPEFYLDSGNLRIAPQKATPSRNKAILVLNHHFPLISYSIRP